MHVEHLKEFLQKNKASFKIIYHEKPINSSQDGVNYFGIDIGQTAPIIIIKTGEGFYALIVSGERGKINLESITHILGCRKARLATKEEIKKRDFHPGSIPLVGHNLPCILDIRLFRFHFVYGGSGFPSYTLKINPKDLEKLNNLIGKIE